MAGAITEDLVVLIRNALEPIANANSELRIAVVLVAEPDVSIIRWGMEQAEIPHLFSWIAGTEVAATVDVPVLS